MDGWMNRRTNKPKAKCPFNFCKVVNMIITSVASNAHIEEITKCGYLECTKQYRVLAIRSMHMHLKHIFLYFCPLSACIYFAIKYGP